MADELTEQQKAQLEEARRVTTEEQAKGYTSQRVFEAKPIEPKPIEQPEPEPMTVPDITPPPDAQVVERDAQGNPTVKMDSNGEKYFLPGSTPYSMGFRTQSEYIEAQSVSATHGPHDIGDDKEPSVIILRDGRPVARVFESQIKKSQEEKLGYDWSAYLAPDYKGDINDARIPVKNSEGKEVLLTVKQADKLGEAKDTNEQLDLAKQFKLVPHDTTIKQFTATISDSTGAQQFVTQQESKRQQEALSQLSKYKDAEGYNLGKAIADGVSPYILERAAFERADIEQAQREATYIKATPKGKFDILKKDGLIPEKAIFTGQNADGSINYLTEPIYQTPGRHPLPIGSDIKFTDVPASLLYKDPETSGGTGHMTSTVARTPFELQVMAAEGEERFANVVGLVPVVGTAYLIAKKAPAKDIAISAATDALVFAPVGKLFGAIRSVVDPGAKEAATVQKTIASEIAASRNTLKAVTNKETVKAFDDLTKASKQYAKNLSDIKIAEKTIRNVPESNLAMIAKSDLPTLQAASQDLKTKALQKAYTFSESLGRSGAAGDVPLSEAAREASAQHIRGIEQAVNQIFDESPKNVKAMSKQLKKWQSQLEMARFDKDIPKINELQNKIPELKSQIRMVYTAEAQRLSSERLINTSRINQLRKDLITLREPTVEAEKVTGSTEGIRNQIKALEARQKTLDKAAIDATKRLEIDWGPPIPRSSGRGGIGTKAPPRIGGGGGGVRLSEKPTQTLLPLGAKIIYQGIDGEIQYTIPLPQPLGGGAFKMAVEAPTRPAPSPKRTIPLPKWWPRPTPKTPEPMPITTPEPERRTRPGELPKKAPGEEPTPVIAPRPEPGPGIKPGRKEEPFRPAPVFVPAPQVAPAVKVGAAVYSGTETHHLTKTEAKAINKAIDKLKTNIRQGMSADEAIKQANKAMTGTKLSIQSQIKTTPTTLTREEAVTKTGTGIITKTGIKIKEPPPPPPPPPFIPHGPKQDKANRKRILKSGGAIAWRMGKVGGKDRYDVIVDPYSSNEDYMMVLGAPPKGAVIAKGPTSAYRTAKMLYGKPPKKAVHIDSGFQDITVQPTDHKIELTFKPDPLGLTRGDIQIGHVAPRITGKPPRISAGRGRITSSRPRIGR